MRDKLIEIYLDWRNNYLTCAKWAEHNGMTEKQAHDLLSMGRELWQTPHPEA